MLRNEYKIQEKGRMRIQTAIQDNEFLDDFLKPPHRVKQSSKKQLKAASPIRFQHLSVPSRLPPPITHTHTNNQVHHILRAIKKDQEVRRKRTRQFMERVAAEKEEEKKLYEFNIAERRIKKRLMLLHRKEHIHQELLSFVQVNTQPTTDLRQYRTKSLQEATLNSYTPNRRQTPLIRTKQPQQQTAISQHSPSRVQASTENILPQLNNGGAFAFRAGKKRLSRISTITLTKELRIEDLSKPIQNDYLQELKNKRRNYTESNKELRGLYKEREASTEKKERAVELVAKIDHQRRTKLKNPNDMDCKQAKRKIGLLNFLHRQ